MKRHRTDTARALPPMAGLAVTPGLALDRGGDDAVAFVEQVEAIVRAVARTIAPPELHVVKLDAWFGQRWVGFSHKILGAAGVSHRKTLRVPPFVPARVVSQRDYLREPGGRYVPYPSAPPLHIRQTSEANRRRLVSVLYPGAALFWWSGATQSSGRGSLMAYLPLGDAGPDEGTGHVAWYAELARDAGGSWRLSRTSGISAEELRRHVDDESGTAA